MTTKVLIKLVNICASLSGAITSSTLIDLFYPVESIYTSMNSTEPPELFEGTWEQTIDRFLYCADSNGSTGVSSTVSEANLPAHTHTFSGANVNIVLNVRPTSSTNVLENKSGNILSVSSRTGGTKDSVISTTSSSEACDLLTFNYTPAGTLSSTGSGEEFLPPYLTVYAWYRTV